MTLPPDLIPAIESNAESPQKVVTDGVVVESQDLLEQIAADKYLKASAAVSGRFFGLGVRKQRPPNPGDVDCGRFNDWGCW